MTVVLLLTLGQPQNNMQAALVADASRHAVQAEGLHTS